MLVMVFDNGLLLLSFGSCRMAALMVAAGEQAIPASINDSFLFPGTLQRE